MKRRKVVVSWAIVAAVAIVVPAAARQGAPGQGPGKQSTVGTTAAAKAAKALRLARMNRSPGL